MMASKTLLAETKSQLNSLLWKLPITGDFMWRRYLHKNFQVEMDLINGKDRSENNHRSIIHFSMNKAATQYVRDLLRRCAAENGMVNVGIAEYAFHTSFPYLDDLSANEMNKYQHIFKPTGYLYSVFGGMIQGIENLERYLIILVIRDPRDMLVSHYYSIAYSHSVPSKRGNKYNDFIEKRRRAQRTSIDEYVIGECENVYNVYQRYIDLLLSSYPHVYVTKYEDMISDFSTWLDKLLEYCELKASSELQQSLLDESKKLKPRKENVYQHIRKGISGDYKEKLSQETINYINSRLSFVLERFNYV
jgi:hypothetical protein